MSKNYFTDIQPDEMNYDAVFKCVTECGQAHNPRSFAIDILHNIGEIIPFDQALCFFIDGNGKVEGQYLRNIDEKWTKLYFEYYSQVENRKFSYSKNVRENPNSPTINVHDWANEDSSEFVPDYINTRGIRYSCGFSLFDLYGNYRMIFSLDRIYDIPFSNYELYNLKQVVIMLNNLHKNFYFQGTSLAKVKQKTWQEAKLTAREIEVVDLLSQGISPSNISKILYISPSTTYKHIAHIYEKMGVSSQREFLVKLLRE